MHDILDIAESICLIRNAHKENFTGEYSKSIAVYFGRPKIENIKTEFRRKAKPKVGSMANVTHIAGGGQKKVCKCSKDLCYIKVTKVYNHTML